MRPIRQIIATTLLIAAGLPLACPAPALAESRSTRSVIVTATVPAMLQVTPAAFAPRRIEGPAAAAAPERKTISLTASPEAVTNHGALLTQEWRRSPDGRNVRLYTSVVI